MSDCCDVFVIPFILDVRLVDAPAGVTQGEGHTGFRVFGTPGRYINSSRSVRSALEIVLQVCREVPWNCLRAVT